MRRLIEICLVAIGVALLLACGVSAEDANTTANGKLAPPDPDVYAIRPTDDDRNHWAFRHVPPIWPALPSRSERDDYR